MTILYRKQNIITPRLATTCLDNTCTHVHLPSPPRPAPPRPSPAQERFSACALSRKKSPPNLLVEEVKAVVFSVRKTPPTRIRFPLFCARTKFFLLGGGVLAWFSQVLSQKSFTPTSHKRPAEIGMPGLRCEQDVWAHLWGGWTRWQPDMTEHSESNIDRLTKGLRV